MDGDYREDCSCPLCGHACEHRGHLRGHIHRHHRKSAVIEAYLGAVEASASESDPGRESAPSDADPSPRRPVVRRTNPSAR